MAAWMMARSDGKLSKAIYYTLILTMLIPFQTLMMPLMQEMNSLEKLLGIQIKDTIGGLIFMYIGFGAGMGVFMFYGFVKGSLPRTLEEAAIIDGCNTWQLFWRVVFPLMKPTIITLVILDVIWIWNDYLLPYLIFSGTNYRTIPIHIQYLNGSYGQTDMGAIMALIIVSILPIIIFYFACQKYIIEGVVAGAVKG